MEEKMSVAKAAAEPLIGKDSKNLFYSVLNATLAVETGDKKLAETYVQRIREGFPDLSKIRRGVWPSVVCRKICPTG